MNRIVLSLLMLIVALPLASCDALSDATGGTAEPPTLDHKNTALTESPEALALSKFYCAELFPNGFGLGISCGTFGLGNPPVAESLNFNFEITFEIQNPNTLPIPTLSMLLAIQLFPEDPNGPQDLGAVCVTFCDPSDMSCNGTSAQDACASSDNDIRSLEDFASNARDNFLNILSGDTSALRDNISIKTIPARNADGTPGTIELKVIFTLNASAMLDIILNVGRQVIEQLISPTSNGSVAIAIQYKLEGTVWVDLPFGFGRFGVGFSLPTDEFVFDVGF